MGEVGRKDWLRALSHVSLSPRGNAENSPKTRDKFGSEEWWADKSEGGHWLVVVRVIKLTGRR